MPSASAARLLPQVGQEAAWPQFPPKPPHVLGSCLACVDLCVGCACWVNWAVFTALPAPHLGWSPSPVAGEPLGEPCTAQVYLRGVSEKGCARGVDHGASCWWQAPSAGLWGSGAWGPYWRKAVISEPGPILSFLPRSCPQSYKVTVLRLLERWGN